MAPTLPTDVALVNGSMPLDGHTQVLRMDTLALGQLGIKWRWYQCVDPSTPLPHSTGEIDVKGWKIPFGRNLERGINRLLPVYARRLRTLDAKAVHVNDVYLARLSAYRTDVIVNIADLSKLTTRFYPRAASMIHNYNLRFVGGCSGIAALSAFTAREVVNLLRVDSDKVHVVSPFSMIPRMQGPRRPPDGRPSTEDPFHLLYVATDRPHKNIDGFLRILSELGNGYDGTLVATLSPESRRRMASFGLGPRLRVVSEIENLTAIYDQADALIHPSRYEGFGLPLVEAMARSLPLIASECTAIPEVVGDGGQLLPPDDLGAWVTAVRGLSDPSHYEKWAALSWTRGGQFTLPKTAGQLSELYEAVTV